MTRHVHPILLHFCHWGERITTTPLIFFRYNFGPLVFVSLNVWYILNLDKVGRKLNFTIKQ